jgi:hypothetical protein
MFPEIGDQEAKRKRIKPIPILQASGQAQAVFGKVPSAEDASFGNV